MEIKHIVTHVKYLMSMTPDSTFERNLEHAIEELGEVAKAHRNLRYATKALSADDPQLAEAKDHLIEESVDHAITGFAVYIAAGGRPDQFYDILMRKCGKWESNVKAKEPLVSSPEEN